LLLRRALTALAGLTAAALVGCALWRPATVPLRTITAPAHCATPPDILLVLLPGSYSLPEEFLSEGFVQTVRERRLAADVLLVDAHVGYYNNRSIIERLRVDVVEPARARGYRQVWLAGISIGAVGAMIYADARPDDVDGIVMLAPYLGTRLAAQEIKTSGGLAAWRAPAVSADAELDATLWRWLQAQTGTGTASATKKVPLFLGYGRDDRFAFNDEVLAQAMPRSRVFTAEGGHDWHAWRPLWRDVVNVIPIPSDPGCAAQP
jgi:pimeloyl-ACP methyl ester carboxylesterase